MNLIQIYLEWIEDVSDYFTADAYTYAFGESDRFPSLMSKIVRFLLRYLYVVVAVAWVALIVLTALEGLPFLAIILVPPIAAALVLLLVAVLFAALMLIESFCKIIASMILYDELPSGAENPPDALLMFLLN